MRKPMLAAIHHSVWEDKAPCAVDERIKLCQGKRAGTVSETISPPLSHGPFAERVFEND